jgi:DNA-binding transcriptional MocR family regulator
MPKPTAAEWSPKWALKRRPGSPLYLQVEEFLRGLIRLRPFENGEFLPDEVTLAKELGVSLGTVRNSLSRLVNEGMLERKAGIGTRVIRRPVESGIVAWCTAAPGLTGFFASNRTRPISFREFSRSPPGAKPAIAENRRVTSASRDHRRTHHSFPPGR